MNKYLVFLVYFVFGLYFVNYPFNYFEFPELILVYNSWIIFLGGILILIASFNFLKVPHAPK